MMALDTAIFKYLNSWAGRSAFWDDALIFGSDALGFLLLVALLLPLLFLLIKRLRRLGRDKVLSWAEETKKEHLMILHALAAAVLAKFVFADFIKWIVARARPFDVLEGVNRLIFGMSDFAFPSGHASFYFALAVGIYFWRPKFSILFFASAAVVSVSRVAAGAHWPSDILVGVALGILSAWIIKKFVPRVGVEPT